MNFFDLHNDTAFEMFKKKESLFKNSLCVDIESFGVFEKKAAVFAIWSDNSKDEERVYSDFFEIVDYFKKEIKENEKRAVFCESKKELLQEDERLKILLSVEGGEIIGNDLYRLEKLRESGVKVFTPCWKGVNKVAGSFDTENGFTEFGRKVIEMCESLGIIIDVSHMSEKSFYDFEKISTKPFFASHSCIKSVCNHKRNLSENQCKVIYEHEGIVGVNLVKEHLSDKKSVFNEGSVIESVCKNVSEYLKVLGTDKVCFGTDFDGTKSLCGFEKVNKIQKFESIFQKLGLSLQTINNIFYNNAMNFFEKGL